MICDPCLHRRRDLERGMNAAEVVERNVERHRCLHVRQCLAVSVRQSREPAKMHPDAEIRALNV